MRRVVFLAVLFLAQPARAHLGAVVANARFTKPPPPSVTAVDAGVALAPFTFESTGPGSFTYTVSWEDGDNDPTGRFYFYFLDHCPSFAVAPADIKTMATSIPDGALGIWASCDCNPDAGVICPDAGVRDCRNSITWDTSTLATGTYWVIAVNDDPPYLVYSVSGSPVRVQHQAADPQPPAAIVLRPDGFGSWDTSYRTQWYAVGKPPLTIDLSYGIDDPTKVLGPTTSLIKDVHGYQNPDGTVAWDWDVSGLESLGVYFLRVTVTDGNGAAFSTYTDSRYQLSVFHPDLDAGAGPTDMHVSGDGHITLKPPPGGCALAPGESALVLAGPLLVALALLALALRLARR
ncbi:MAG TPA: hypothetical protein VFF06_11810 [Polyangia bacterium]|nr:hypothetical protein [Polyangia bacterium]